MSQRQSFLVVISTLCLVILLPVFASAQYTRNDVFAYGGVPAQCTGSNLSVKRVSDDAGLGNRAVNYAFTNISNAPCTLTGYSGFILLNRAGRPVRGAHVIKGEGTYFQQAEPPQTVTLQPGGTAWFQIAYYACSGRGLCPVSTKVLITAPGTNRGFTLRERIEPSEGKVNLTPVRNGLPQK